MTLLDAAADTLIQMYSPTIVAVNPIQPRQISPEEQGKIWRRIRLTLHIDIDPLDESECGNGIVCEVADAMKTILKKLIIAVTLMPREHQDILLDW